MVSGATTKLQCAVASTGYSVDSNGLVTSNAAPVPSPRAGGDGGGDGGGGSMIPAVAGGGVAFAVLCALVYFKLFHKGKRSSGSADKEVKDNVAPSVASVGIMPTLVVSRSVTKTDVSRSPSTSPPKKPPIEVEYTSDSDSDGMTTV